MYKTNINLVCKVFNHLFENQNHYDVITNKTKNGYTIQMKEEIDGTWICCIKLANKNKGFYRHKNLEIAIKAALISSKCRNRFFMSQFLTRNYYE